jgi:cathepsin L
VTPVKNQGNCGSCYAFGSVGAFESQHFIKTGKLILLSEQQIVDCSGQSGCHGGTNEATFRYIANTGGMESAASYVYSASDDHECQFDRSKVVTNGSGYVVLEANEENFKNAVAIAGPIAVGIYAAKSFQTYAGGVYDEPNCGGIRNHALLVIGYGSDNGHDYWLVKNSWGEDWGEKGFIKMSRNKNNQCSIASDGSYPMDVGAIATQN